MLPGSRKHIVFGAVVAVAVVIVLVWPVGTWLRREDLYVGNEIRPDAIYLVAGAKDQNRRIYAIMQWLEGHTSLASGMKGASGIRHPASSIRILIGNDTSEGRWSREEQRNPTMSEWAVRKLAGWGTEIIPGQFSGTDGEMELLAGYLKGRLDIRSIALVTSPFHFRRAVRRLHVYLTQEVKVFVLPAEERWVDRAPWMVLAELAKMFRDRLGLSRSRLLSRGTSYEQE